ncbi:MAG: hypothetical protein HY807_08505 [Nitrospirae bacterium]|nr:hypothetical protein [Nitrospirota bacterium]
MGKNVIVSFEGDIVKVAYISTKGKQIVVNDALTCKKEDFDSFLEKEKAKEFIVVNNFKDAFQDIFLIPPVKAKYAKSLIESEIKQKSPFEDFTYTYRVVGEKLEGNRKMQEISVYVVKTEDVKNITERFIEKGKLVKAVFPHIYAVASEMHFDDESVLCVSESGQSRVLFLIKNGKIEFVRSVQASENGISDADIQSINVTVNYCKQVLKASPSYIVLVGNLCGNYNATTQIDIPIVCPLKPKNLKVQNDIYLDFIFAISARSALKEANVSPKDYKSFYSTWKLFQYSTVAFIIISLAGGLYASYGIFNVLSSRGKMSSLKKEITGMDKNTLTMYNKRKTEFESYKGFIESSSKTAAMPVIKNFLTSFADANTKNVSIGTITMKINGDTLNVSISGLVNEAEDDGKEGFQKYTYYQEFIDSVTKLNGISIIKHELTPKQRDFIIELESK